MSRRALQVRVAVTLLGTGLLGILAGHWVDYLLVFPDSAVRAHVLASSGHAYLSSLACAAAMGGFLGWAIMFWVGWTQNISSSGRILRSRNLFVPLASLQAGGFALMEFLERLQAGTPVHHAWFPALPLGILIQVVVAVLGTLAILFFLRAGQRVAESFGKTPRSQAAPVISIRPEFTTLARYLVWFSSRPTRAPPAAPLF